MSFANTHSPCALSKVHARIFPRGGPPPTELNPRANFGLGTFDKAAEVRVRWLNGTEFVLKDVGTNQVVTVGFNPVEASEMQSVYLVYLPIVENGEP